MNKSTPSINQLHSIRNRYGKNYSFQKLKLLNALNTEEIKTKNALQSYHGCLQFLIAYPDNKDVYNNALRSLQQLQFYIKDHKKIRDGLFNSGITNTQLIAAFGFEIIRWLRAEYPENVRLSSIEADDSQVHAVLAVVMPRVESEVLLDGNSDWKSWLKKSMKKGEDLLDRLIALFNETDLRPGVKDELWNALVVNVEITLPLNDHLPGSLIFPYYHRSLLKKNFSDDASGQKPVPVQLDKTQANQIINCARMVLIRHFREIDPISFTAASFVSYYRLPRGLSIALMSMTPQRRNPIDSYMGYTVFKNGLPVAYAGSWILFDSGRIGLNIFPAYRGGESQYIFEQILKVHQKVYQLKRFSVDPYQIGKDNSDGIHSGAFWTYYRAGFRSIRKEQKELAETEAKKISADKNYRSPARILTRLADSRMEMIMHKNAVRFDATDLSRVYAKIVDEQYQNNRKSAEESSLKKMLKVLRLNSTSEETLQFVLKNWSVLLFSKEQELSRSSILIKTLKDLFNLKAKGSEEDYIKGLQRAVELRKFLEQKFMGNL